MVTLTKEMTMPRVSFTRRIVRDYRTRIESGDLASGDKLPTLDEIAAAYGCSLTPVKSAIRILEALGLVETQPGKGMYVAGVPGSTENDSSP